MSRPFTAAWLAGDASATRFLARGFDDPVARRAAVESARPMAPEVLAAIRAQEASRPSSPSRAASLDALERGAAAVVTGQQVGLFLGPLYTLHKAAAAVVAARALAAETGRAVVPIFWLQSEDHDFAEVRTAVVPGPHGLVEVACPDDGRRVSLSERRFAEPPGSADPQLVPPGSAELQLGSSPTHAPGSAELQLGSSSAHAPGSADPQLVPHGSADPQLVPPGSAELQLGSSPAHAPGSADPQLVPPGSAELQLGSSPTHAPRSANPQLVPPGSADPQLVPPGSADPQLVPPGSAELQLGSSSAAASSASSAPPADPASLVRALALSGPHAAEVEALLARHYHPDATWPDAFAGVLAELFADWGLVIVDPRKMAPLARDLHRFSWDSAAALEAALAARCDELAAAGFDVQIAVRPGATLSCVDHRGARHRLMQTGEVGPAGDSASIDVIAALEASPERFTTTALLRPLLQDRWLPTAAYVGGPGELAYFAELAPLYQLAGLRPPLAVPRARFVLVGATARRLAEQLELTPDDATRPPAELAAMLAARVAPDSSEATHEALRRALDDGLAALTRDADARGDHGFDKHAHKAAEVVRGALDKLRDRARRHALDADRLTAERLARLLAWLAPRGAPQERVLAFPPFAAQVGPRELVQRIVDATVPFDGQLRRIDL